jgi:hypothetical protein
MHVPDEAKIGPGQSVAILGPALRFPGASDPSSFHEITVAGRPMFRELAHRTDNGGLPEHGAGRPSRLAALLDDAAPRFGRDDALAGGITARHVLAAETAAAALADVPPAGRAVAAERIGVFIADIPEPGTADIRDWVHRHLGTLAADDTATSPARGRDAGASHPCRQPPSWRKTSPARPGPSTPPHRVCPFCPGCPGGTAARSMITEIGSSANFVVLVTLGAA